MKILFLVATLFASTSFADYTTLQKINDENSTSITTDFDAIQTKINKRGDLKITEVQIKLDMNIFKESCRRFMGCLALYEPSQKIPSSILDTSVAIFEYKDSFEYEGDRYEFTCNSTRCMLIANATSTSSDTLRKVLNQLQDTYSIYIAHK